MRAANSAAPQVPRRAPWRRVEPEIPEAFAGLLQPMRYKVYYGGRGSAKSHSVARVALAEGACKPQNEPWRVLCTREIQNSIRESVHQLLAEQIAAMGIGDLYEIQDAVIRGRPRTQAAGTEFIFSGLRYKIDSIRSIENIKRCLVEEAHTVRKTSWEKLTPTIRVPGSEIWIVFNPELETDETYQRFVVHPPRDSIVRKVTWRDNPWFSDELRAELRETRRRSEDDYLNIWEGFTRQTLDGAIYANELREAQAQGRITKVPYDEAHPVNTYWDLGWADKTAIWFVQKIGFEYRAIDYVEDQQRKLTHYVKILQDRGYIYDRHFLPHDGGARELRTGQSAEEIIEGMGYEATVLPRTDPSLGINAARTLFGQCWFDEERCADGLHALRHYRYEVDPETGQFSQRPLHDQNSHGADAWRTFAMSKKETRGRPQLKPPTIRPRFLHPRAAGQAWMR